MIFKLFKILIFILDLQYVHPLNGNYHVDIII